MRRTLTLLATTLVVAAGITSTASAATLYTNAAHTTPVAVGTTFTVANPPGVSYWMYYASTGGVLDGCSANALYLKVTQNSGGVFKAELAGPWRTLSACANPWGAGHTGSLQISGSSTTVGSSKSWAATTLTGFLTLSGVTMIENFSGAGISAQQPTVGATPVSVVLDHAGTMTGGGLNLTVSGTYRFPGAYSLG
jgi:hypothetical protein